MRSKLIIISSSDMFLSHKEDIITSLNKEMKEKILEDVTVIRLQSDFTNIDTLGEKLAQTEEFNKLVFVIDDFISVQRGLFEKISSSANKTFVAYKYDNVSKYDQSKDKLVFLSQSFEQRVYDKSSALYSKGHSEESISEYLSEHKLSFKEFISRFIDDNIKKPSNRLSEDLKMAISERDKCGIPRKAIARELNINYKTVQRSCEKYGNPNKNMDKVDDKDVLELVTNDFVIDNKSRLICPRCNLATNSIKDGWSVNTYYCKRCLEEYVIMTDINTKETTCNRVKWENIN